MVMRLSFHSAAPERLTPEKETVLRMTMEKRAATACGVKERDHILQGHYRIITHMAGLQAFKVPDNILRIKDVSAALCQGPGPLTHSNAKGRR